MSKSTQTTPETILAQLGGSGFRVMTGAKDIMADGENTLRFKLTSGKYNFVTITLNPSDLYDMAFFKYSRDWSTIRKTETHEDVYCDQMQAIFTQATGLNTHL